jgi:hypothetical protein
MGGDVWGEKMTVARFRVTAIAAALLLTFSAPSLAAKRTSHTKDTPKLQSRAIKPNGSAIRPHSDPYPYSREPDPYAPGVNWPKGA